MKKQSEELEIKIYRIMGIELFRKFIMRYEKFIHRKDRGRNINYHLGGFSDSSTKRFYAFLSYNASVHILSSIIVVLYFLFKSKFIPKIIFPDFPMIFLLVLNFYCIILQRYNLITLRYFHAKYQKSRAGRIHRLENKLIKQLVSDYPKEYIDEDLSFLYRIRSAVQNREYFYLRKNDVSVMNRLSEHTCNLMKKRESRVSECTDSERTVSHIVREIYEKSPYTKIEKRVDILQKIFKIKDKVLSPVCTIFTDGYEEETAFRKLFCSDSEDTLSETAEILISVLENTREEQNNYVE